MVSKVLRNMFNVLAVSGALLMLCSIDDWETKRMAVGFMMMLPVIFRAIIEDLSCAPEDSDSGE